MSTQEGNKLIAEFMGCYPDRVYWGNEPAIVWGFKDTHISERWHESDFTDRTPYHSSWDWLMPVVEKIEDLGNIFTISQTYCNIQEDKHNVSITGVKYGKTKMEAVYQAVIQFITWYNQQGTKINR